jgi:glycosyltransferase involved in cell wall biosynthesis
MRTSVALCCYNGAPYLPAQLDSIARQRVMPDQCIIVDDGSTDSSVEIARAFAARAPFEVQVHVNAENLGFVRNFELAISKCEHEIIFLADHDDVWLPNRIADSLKAFEASPSVLLVHGNAGLIDATSEPLGYTLFEALELSIFEKGRLGAGSTFDALLRRNLMTGATTAFRKSLADIALPVAPGWLHDEWLAVIASAIGKTRTLEQPLILYRQHENNQIGARRLTFPEKVRRAFAARNDYHDKQFVRASSLHQRLCGLVDLVGVEKLKKVEEKVIHSRSRCNLPRNRLMRWGPILAEIRSGRYWKYSTGFRSVVRDLFEST